MVLIESGFWQRYGNYPFQVVKDSLNFITISAKGILQHLIIVTFQNDI